MPTKNEITDLAMDLEMQLAAARKTAVAAQQVLKQYNTEMDENLNEEAFPETIEAIDKAIQSVLQPDY